MDIVNDDSPNLRFSMWIEDTQRGLLQRASYDSKSEAIENAKKYWLTPVGLFRAFVRDRDESEAIIYDRSYLAPKARAGSAH